MSNLNMLNIDVRNETLSILKDEYETAYNRLCNALLYPETRDEVHTKLVSKGREYKSGIFVGTWGLESKLYGNLLAKSWRSVTDYYLAARQQDLDIAHKAYDDFLSGCLDIK